MPITYITTDIFYIQIKYPKTKICFPIETTRKRLYTSNQLLLIIASAIKAVCPGNNWKNVQPVLGRFQSKETSLSIEEYWFPKWMSEAC